MLCRLIAAAIFISGLAVAIPLAAQNAPDCEVSFADLDPQSDTFLRNADERLSNLSEIMNEMDSDHLEDFVFELMRWVTLADAALQIDHKNVRLPDCREYETLEKTYRDTISDTYEIVVQIMMLTQLTNEYQIERVSSLLEDNLKGVAIKLELWRFGYEMMKSPGEPVG